MARGYVELEDAKPEYEKRRQYAEGTRPEVFLSAKDYARLGAVGSRYRINFLATAIDAPCDLIEVASVTVPSDDGATERVQSEVWDANNLLEEYPALVRMVATYGDAYWITYEGAGEDDARVNLHRPTTVRAIYSGTETRTPDFWVQTWTVKGDGDAKLTRGNVYTVDEDGGGSIEEWVAGEGKGKKPSDWMPVVRDDAEENVVSHEYGQIVWHFRINSTPHGTPAHAAGYGAQDAITKLIVSHMGAVDFTVTPLRWALEDESAGEGASDDIDYAMTPTTQAALVRPGASGQTSKLKAGAGQIAILRGIKAVGQFEAAAPAAFLDPLGFYIKALSQRVKVPFFYFDSGDAMPTGIARRQADKPLIRMASTWAQGIASVASRGLGKAAEIAGIGTDLKVDVRYKPFSSVDDAEGWAMIKAKNDAGVPLKVTLMEAGYTAEQVEAWYPEDETPDLSVSQLASLADTLQKLAASVTLGIITQPEARALLPRDLMLAAADDPEMDTGEPASPAELTGDDIVKRVNAAGTLIRSGFDPVAALEGVGLDPIKHLGLLPVTVQKPTTPVDAPSLDPEF